MNTGGRYYPGTDSWLETSTSGDCPSDRMDIKYAVVWADEMGEMIVWGGIGFPDIVGDGALYDPSTDTWDGVSDVGAPEPRARHTIVWTGQEFIVWGGMYDDSGDFIEFNDGGHYDPVTDSWSPTTTTNAPEARYNHTAVWTGTEMIVWGGSIEESDDYFYFADGARYWCEPD